MKTYEPTAINNVSIELKRKKKKGKGIYTGQVVDAKTGIPITGLNRVQKTIIDVMDDFCKRAVITDLVDMYHNNFDKPKQQKKCKGERGVFSETFEHCKEIDENLSFLRKYDWNNDTFNGTLNYLSRQVLPLLDKIGTQISSNDITELQSTLTQKAFDCGRSKKDANTARNSVRQILRRCNFVYQRMRENCPEFSLPDIDLTIAGQGNYVQLEQCKALPDEVRVKFSALLYRLIKTKIGGLVLGIALMLYVGLRTSEAAGVDFYLIEYNDGYTTLFVRQQEKNGVITPILKSQNAYRDTVLPKIAVDLIRLRIEYLTVLGYTKDDIKTMPVVCLPCDPRTRARSNNLSALGKKLLLSSGLLSRFISSAESLMYVEPDVIDGERVIDVTTYILRRDWCTRAFANCGMVGNMVDYLLGHKRINKRGLDFRTPEAQKDITALLERYVFDPSYSSNPAFLPVSLEPGYDKMLVPYQTSTFVTNDSIEFATIILDIECCEPSEVITITLPSSADITVSRRDSFDSPDKRKIRPLIGNVYGNEYYESLIDEAQLIELKDLEAI